MEQYSATCPHCNFVLQFYDASLFGRKGRCPKCRKKFVLNRSAYDTPEAAPAPIKPSLPARPKTESRSKSADVSIEQNAPSPPPVVDQTPKPAAPAVPKPSPANNETAWEMDGNRGMELRRPTLPARWVFPDVLAVTNMLVIAIGASTGMGIMSLIMKDSPLSYLAAASTTGGLIAAAFLVRRHKPQR